MTLLKEVTAALKENRPLFAFMLIKQYVEDHQLLDESEECLNLVKAVKVMPWLNDESWRYFVPSLPEEEIKLLALRIQNCIKVE
ncbi:MAG: hypothetical protein QXR57_07345 [Metallosphaera sp.]|uniref:Uncharacterized protein n=1 Tax=Metallosphaera cuprina (strain Ar-4) TaxID=1006006 RepID=F4G0H2_METCR|nr:hypothetical protein [Metallosphaera cuprina]AEB95859.1 conserved hypothetical protein [Metallosphaera cuprina Ar-4]